MAKARLGTVLENGQDVVTPRPIVIDKPCRAGASVAYRDPATKRTKAIGLLVRRDQKNMVEVETEESDGNKKLLLIEDANEGSMLIMFEARK